MAKVLAIGDVHTKIWLIDKITNVIKDYDKVIFCGDYADDFSASPQNTISTWKALKNLQAKNQGKVELVMGNHDYIYVHDTPSFQTGYNPTTHILIDIPENKDLKEWLISLPVIIKIDDVSYSHAGITNEWSGSEDVIGLWNNSSPIWARPNSNTTYKNIPQVFGHTPSKTCHEVKHNVWCIDTFSTFPDGSSFGDGSVLEITNGNKFSKTYLK